MNPESVKVVKHRKSLSVAQKIEIIKRLESGEKSKDVRALFNISSSTIRTIYLQREKLKEVMASSAAGAYLHRVSKSREGIVEQVEKYLCHWIDSLDNRYTLPYSAIQEKALSLFNDLKKKAQEEGTPIKADVDFKASHGWYERFKKRANLGKHKQTNTEKGNPDVAIFPIEIQKTIEDIGFSSKQIFNLTTTGLFWKRMPTRTFISVEEKQISGYRVSNERLSLLFGGNLEGDLKLMPLLVYHSESPKALEGIVKTKLPVLWYCNKKAWVDSQIFMHYLSSYFAPVVQNYCTQKEVDNKVLLILDNSPCYIKNIEDIETNIRTVFLPTSTSTHLQPLEQGIIQIFKAYYLENVLQYFVSGLVTNDDSDITVLWKNYNIKMAIDNIVLAWEKVSKLSMNACWKKLVPKMTNSQVDFKEVLENTQNNIVQKYKDVGFGDIDKDDIEELLKSHDNDLTNDELFQLMQERPKDLDEDQDKPAGLKVLDADTLTTVFNLANEMCRLLDQNDPNMQRSSTFKRKVDELLSGYFELYKAKKSLIRPDMETNPEPEPLISQQDFQQNFVKVECVLNDDGNPEIEPSTCQEQDFRQNFKVECVLNGDENSEPEPPTSQEQDFHQNFVKVECVLNDDELYT